MRRQQRLKRRKDIAAVFSGGRAYARGPLVVRVRANPETPCPRYAFAASRKVGGAVVRNRIKRRLREAARAGKAEGQVDVVVIARPQARDATYQDLARTLRRLLSDAGLRPTMESNV